MKKNRKRMFYLANAAALGMAIAMAKAKVMHRILTALMAALIVDAAMADTHYVDLNNPSPVPPYTNGWASAANTITAAVLHAQTVVGDVVLVNTGVYVLGATIEMNKSIAIIANSTNRQDVVVDGASTCRCFYIGAGGAITGSLEGFTIRYGLTNANGAGILCYPSATAGNRFTIANCTIISNTATSGGGGGVYLYTNSLLTNCTIQANVAPSGGGGGVYCNGGAVIRNCVISGNSASGNYGGGVRFYAASGSGSAFMLDSVISNNTSGYYGGGVCAAAGCTVSNCTIVNNIITANGGGGVVMTTGYGILRNCTIARNIATNCNGGGVYFETAGTIENCTIRDNTATGSAGAGKGGGAGVFLYEKNNIVRNCLIVSNSAGGHGSGMYFAYGAAGGTNKFQNCTIAGNTAVGTGGGLYLASWAGVTNYVENTIVYFNAGSANSNWYAAGTYSFTNSCIAPTNNHNGSGNLAADPLFVDRGSGNYRLLSGSPCINAGLNADWMINAVDLDGRSRLDRWSRLVDIGAYEYIPSGTILMMR